jgi:hypothetical protein
LDELDEKPNYTKISKERTARKMTHYLNHLTKQLCSMDSKCLVLNVNHMCKK